MMKKNIYWNTIGFGIYSFCYSILLLIITRISGLEQAGIFSLMYATANIIAQIAQYGGRTYHVTDKTKYKYNGTYVITRLLTALIATIIILILCIIHKYNLNLSIIFISLCMTKVIDAISDTYHGIMQIDNKLYKAGISLSFKTIMSIIAFTIILKFTGSLMYASIILPIIATIFLIFYDKNIVKNICSFELKKDSVKMKEIIKNCFYLFCGNFLLTYIVNIPKYILEDFVSKSDQGIYAILIMPAFIVTMLASFLIQPFLITLAEKFEKKYDEYKKLTLQITGIICLIFLFILVAGYFLGLPIMSILFNIDLSKYRLELVIVIISSLFYTMSSFIFLNLTLLRKMRSLLYINGIVAIIGYVISYFIIKKYLLFGSYISFLIIMFIQFILLLLYYLLQLRKKMK